MIRKRSHREEDRKYKRLEARYGPDQPVHRTIAIQVSPVGAFLAANRPIYAVGSRIVIEFRTKKGSFTTRAVVRHAKNLPPQLSQFSRTGMGVQFIEIPPELKEYLESL